jgi:hypothetical protein
MKIYVTHSRSWDYKTGLYLPIRTSSLNNTQEFILPHEFSDEPFDSRPLILGKNLGLVVAEVSIKSTPQGIELGWANSVETPIAFFYQPNSPPSNALGKVSDFFHQYSNHAELISGIEKAIKRFS